MAFWNVLITSPCWSPGPQVLLPFQTKFVIRLMSFGVDVDVDVCWGGSSFELEYNLFSRTAESNIIPLRMWGRSEQKWVNVPFGKNLYPRTFFVMVAILTDFARFSVRVLVVGSGFCWFLAKCYKNRQTTAFPGFRAHGYMFVFIFALSVLRFPLPDLVSIWINWKSNPNKLNRNQIRVAFANAEVDGRSSWYRIRSALFVFARKLCFKYYQSKCTNIEIVIYFSRLEAHWGEATDVKLCEPGGRRFRRMSSKFRV